MTIHVIEVIDRKTDNILYTKYFITEKLAKKYINHYEKLWHIRGLKWSYAPDRLHIWGWD